VIVAESCNAVTLVPDEVLQVPIQLTCAHCYVLAAVNTVYVLTMIHLVTVAQKLYVEIQTSRAPAFAGFEQRK
jgi:hypothetical protein